METYLRDRLAGLGYELPPVPAPAGSYVPAARAGELVFTAGQLPLHHGELLYTGKVGATVTLEEAREAAALCAVNALSAVLSLGDEASGTLRVVKVVGYVASAEGFGGQPQVLNGASELLGEVLGGEGVHARSAVGVAELPFDAPVEVELVVELSPG